MVSACSIKFSDTNQIRKEFRKENFVEHAHTEIILLGNQKFKNDDDFFRIMLLKPFFKLAKK